MALRNLRRYSFSLFVKRGTLYLLIMALFLFYLYLIGNYQGFTQRTINWVLSLVQFLNYCLFFFSLISVLIVLKERIRRLRVLYFLFIMILSGGIFLMLSVVRVWIS